MNGKFIQFRGGLTFYRFFSIVWVQLGNQAVYRAGIRVSA